ncbi:unnamed protein product, partial [Brachionus calyciflorus]
MNKIESDPFSIISGIKQGCALSMILYILVIEELMLRIKSNPNIRGYKLYVLNEREIKCTEYADDIVGYLADHLSISLFFQEFDEWGEISGASINRDKTRVIHVSKKEKEDEDFKVLGVWFNKKGISLHNYKAVFDKIKKALFIWDLPSLNMLERTTICKTFILSKLWFLANFIYISEDKIKDLNSLIFKFIWNSPIELIKRDILILPFEEGGMNMFNLYGRLKNIHMQSFFYIAKSHQRDFFQ